MKVLAVTYANRVPNNDLLYLALANYVTLERIAVDRVQALNLAATLAHLDLLSYDRIVLEIRAKHAMSQWRDLWKLPNLVLYEEDTWQNFVSFSKNFGKFTQYYERVRPVRIIHSGAAVAQKTAALGFDSCFLPKGFDGAKLSNLGNERDIELGFVGRIEHSNYVHRKQLLTALAGVEPLQLLRTSSDEEYLQTLNRIAFFISADVGFGEHMIKNFEAMACGCVVFAYRQGLDDAELGLEDMVNVVFYSSLNELGEKLARLREDQARAMQIAAAGQALAEAKHDHRCLGKRYFKLLAQPLRGAAPITWTRGKGVASKKMSLVFFEQLVGGEDPIGKDFDVTERGLRFRFFPKRNSPFVEDGQSQFIKRSLSLLAPEDPAKTNTPKILYWGVQQEQGLRWVAVALAVAKTVAD